ncbi:MAG: hypothetical protein RLZZ127_244 [Planctomycetota bacterium]|jgi:GT2 family glycosyltransferase
MTGTAAAAIAVVIPTKNRHRELARSLLTVVPAARAAGARVRICDQSPVPFPVPAWCADTVAVDHRPDLRGLPAARNALIAAVAAEVLVFLDDDTDLARDAVVAVRDAAAREPAIAGWGPVCEVRPRRQRRFYRLLRLGAFRDARRLTGARTDAATPELFGCACAFRRSALLAVRGFDARLPGYALGEDQDCGRRLVAAGFRLRFLRGCRAWHRREGANRADPWKGLVNTWRWSRWWAARHGRGEPLTPLHRALAMLGALAAALRG